MRKLVFVCVFLGGAFFFQSQNSVAQDAKPSDDPGKSFAAEAQPDASQNSDTTLRHRPAATDQAGTEFPLPTALHPISLTGGESIPGGMVWVPAGKQWTARELNSCWWCSEPMTFRQAAFDKKALGMWGTALALTVADVEILVSRPCVAAGTCREGNPLLGQTRAEQYGLRIPVLVGAWMGTAWLRKGDQRLKIGGAKRWWVLPVLYQIASGSGIIANLAR
jgi:hypothetical protein